MARADVGKNGKSLALFSKYRVAIETDGGGCNADILASARVHGRAAGVAGYERGRGASFARGGSVVIKRKAADVAFAPVRLGQGARPRGGYSVRQVGQRLWGLRAGRGLSRC